MHYNYSALQSRKIFCVNGEDCFSFRMNLIFEAIQAPSTPEPVNALNSYPDIGVLQLPIACRLVKLHRFNIMDPFLYAPRIGANALANAVQFRVSIHQLI